MKMRRFEERQALNSDQEPLSFTGDESKDHDKRSTVNGCMSEFFNVKGLQASTLSLSLSLS